MTQQGKVWGTTELIESNPVFEFHRIEFKKGGHCSEHCHQTKYNGFYVESGKLMVKMWQGDDLYEPDITFLKKGDFMKVEPGNYHQFIGMEDGVAYELYWSELAPEDITRRTIGFMAPPEDAGEAESDPSNNLNHD